jgi:hypothetical protein
LRGTKLGCETTSLAIDELLTARFRPRAAQLPNVSVHLPELALYDALVEALKGACTSPRGGRCVDDFSLTEHFQRPKCPAHPKTFAIIYARFVNSSPAAAAIRSV